MWTFTEVVRIEQQFDTWTALVTLAKDSVSESFYIKFQSEPTLAFAQQAGQDLATKKNLAEAPLVPVTISKYAFRMKFTLAERIALDTVDINTSLTDQQKQIAQTLLHDFSIKENGIELTNSDTISGVQYLESIGLLGTGRAAQILAL